MSHLFLAGALSLAVPTAALAQAGGGAEKYKTLEYKAGKCVGTLKHPKLMEGAVDLKLTPEDASAKPLWIRCDTARFVWATDDSKTPDAIDLEGNVNVELDLGKVTSSKAKIQVENRVVEFTDNVVFDLGAQGKGNGSRLLIDMNKDEFTLFNAEGSVPWKQDQADAKAAAPDPSLLSPAQIRDWPGLVGKMQSEGKAAAPSPGKQVLQLLSATARQQFTALQPAAIAETMKKPIVDQFNKALRNPDLYDAKAWQEVALGEEAQKLLRRREATPLTAGEATRLNRLLLDAAYPGMIEPVGPGS